MDKQHVIERINAEIEATRARIDAVPGTAESLPSREDEAPDVTAAEEALYLEELRDDLEITEATLDMRDVEAAADAEAGESVGDGLAVVVGHTRTSPGARGMTPPFPVSPNGANHEYAWNSDLARIIKNKAAAAGIRCEVFFRDNGGITGAYSRVRGWRPKATVELHFNAANAAARGTETLYGSSVSKAWAQALQDEMVALYERTGKQNRGLLDRGAGGRGRLSVTQISPSALIEPFFGDAEGDAALGTKRKGNLADAIVVAYGIWSTRAIG